MRVLQVEILSEGDFVNELLILVGGMVELLRPGADAAEELVIDADGHSSLRGTCIRRARAPLSHAPGCTTRASAYWLECCRWWHTASLLEC